MGCHTNGLGRTAPKVTSENDMHTACVLAHGFQHCVCGGPY
jgi:hypothetical protein